VSAISAGNPILVTGSHRSGTTWIGRVLSTGPGVGYIHEPFSLLCPRGVFRYPVPHWYYHVTPETSGPIRDAFAETLGFRFAYGPELRALRTPRQAARAVRNAATFAWNRAAGRRPLVKDPLALLSAEWLASTFDMNVLVSIRHPLGFVSSLVRMGWFFDYSDLLAQERLMSTLLRDSRTDIEQAAASRDPVLNAAVLWKVLHRVIAGYVDRHPDWLFVRYKELASDPLHQFEPIFARLGIPFGDRERKVIEYLSGSGNPEERPNDPRVTRVDSSAHVKSMMRRLSETDRERVRSIVAPVSERFYGADDW
jgi:hypothetical protein